MKKKSILAIALALSFAMVTPTFAFEFPGTDLSDVDDDITDEEPVEEEPFEEEPGEEEPVEVEPEEIDEEEEPVEVEPAGNYIILDDDTTGYNIDQEYTIEQDGATEYKDVKMVQVDWTTKDISVSYKNKKKWDPNSRKWVKNGEDEATNDKGGADFTFTNFSSVPIAATVAFKANDATADLLDKVEFKDDKNTVAIDTPVEKDDNDEEYAIGSFYNGTISVTVSADTSKAISASKANREISGTFGTYTVSIAETEKPAAANDVTYPYTYTISSFEYHPETGWQETKTEYNAVLSSAAMLATEAEAVTYTYDGKNYKAYNGYISATHSSTWYDAMEFVNALNTNNVNGHNDWRLLSSLDDGKAWETEVKNDRYGGVDLVWTSEDAYVDNSDNENVYVYNTGSQGYYYTPKDFSSTVYGFVVICGAE